MLTRLYTGLIAAILLVGLCAVQVCAVEDPPTVEMIFLNMSSKGVIVTFTGLADLHQAALIVSSGQTKTYTFTKNPRVVLTQVEGCLPNKALVKARIETREYASIMTGIDSDCQLHVRYV